MSDSNFAKNIIKFHENLEYKGQLKENVRVMNPFKENDEILTIFKKFYTKYFSDTNSRKIILGINPGRLGAGSTGIPFTDTKRLSEECGIKSLSIQTHEPSSVFIYDLINQYGGVKKFYKEFYINSVCPLGFIEKNKKENWVNCNYYDYMELFQSSKDFITNSLLEQIQFGIDTSICYILGKKNAKFFSKINNEAKLFDKIVVFDHPRYIIQYKMKSKEKYITDYLKELRI